MGYLCRTVRPDPLLPAARAADDLVARTFCQVYHINPAIFLAGATAEQRLAPYVGRSVQSSVDTFTLCWPIQTLPYCIVYCIDTIQHRQRPRKK